MLIEQTNNEFTQRRIFAGLSVIFICCIISYWPVSLGIFSLKNDAVRYFLPVRYQISEMIRNGIFPFWTPYINLGHPLYADMQSGVWNPFVWLISFFDSYNMRSLQIELLLYIYISGASMFFLLKYLKLSFHVSLFAGVSFMLCGFISDSTQFLYWICGIAFLPAIFLFFLKTLKEFSFRSILCFSFSLYLLFVTAYPGEFIIIVYLLFAYFIIYFIQNKKDWFRLLRSSLASVILFILFSLPVIISYLSGLEFITRGDAVGYDLAMSNSMNPLSLVSYFYPLLTWKLPITETDILGRNSFIGLFPFILILLSFVVKSRSTLSLFFKWVFIISLFLSFGKSGLLRPVSYYLLPFMDMFRHPSLFRFLSIFSGCILAAFTFQEILQQNNNSRIKKYIFAFVLLLMAISGIFIFIYDSNGNSHFLPEAFNKSSIKIWLQNSSLINWLIIEILIQAFFLFLIYKYFVRKINLNLLLPVIILNSIIHTALIQPITVVSSETADSFNTTTGQGKQTGFPMPDLHSSVLSNSMTDENYFLKYGPANMYNKKTGYQFEFVTPGPLIFHERFMNAKNFSTLLFNFPYLYKADTILFYQENMNLPLHKRFIVTEDSSLLNSYNKAFVDTSFEAKMLIFSPVKWEFEIESSTAGMYCLFQNFYPDWELYINGKKDKIYLCNLSLTGFRLEPGVNKISLQFKNNKVMMTVYLQLIAFSVFIFYFFVYLLKRKRY